MTRPSASSAPSPGYLSHELKRCIERPDRYLLLVHWRTLEDHTEGVRKSAPYQEWRRLLHHFYEPFPTVEHYAPLPGLSLANDETDPFAYSTPAAEGDRTRAMHEYLREEFLSSFFD